MTKIKVMNRPEAALYLAWQYPEPYTFYNTPKTAWPEVMDEIFSDNGEDYYSSVAGEDEELQGMYEFSFPNGLMEFGLGLRPDLTGQGRGLAFAKEGISFGRNHYHYQGLINLEVADFNARAQHLYAELGFQVTGKRAAQAFGQPVTFIQMQLSGGHLLV